MTDFLADTFWAEEADTTAPKPAPRKRGWVLMGDIVSHRAGVSDHLIQWRRAMGEADPEPMLASSGWKYSSEREG